MAMTGGAVLSQATRGRAATRPWSPPEHHLTKHPARPPAAKMLTTFDIAMRHRARIDRESEMAWRKVADAVAPEFNSTRDWRKLNAFHRAFMPLVTFDILFAAPTGIEYPVCQIDRRGTPLDVAQGWCRWRSVDLGGGRKFHPTRRRAILRSRDAVHFVVNLPVAFKRPGTQASAP